MLPIIQPQSNELLSADTQRNAGTGAADDTDRIGGNFLLLMRAGVGHGDERETDGGNGLPESGSILPSFAPPEGWKFAPLSARAGFSALQAGAAGLAPVAADGIPMETGAVAAHLSDRLGGGSSASAVDPGAGSHRTPAAPATPLTDAERLLAATARAPNPGPEGRIRPGIEPAHLDVSLPAARDSVAGTNATGNGLRMPASDLFTSPGSMHGRAELQGASAQTSAPLSVALSNAAAGPSPARGALDAPPTGTGDRERAGPDVPASTQPRALRPPVSPARSALWPTASEQALRPPNAAAGADRSTIRAGSIPSPSGSSSRGNTSAPGTAADALRVPESPTIAAANARFDDAQAIAERDYSSSPSRAASGHVMAERSSDIDPATIASTNTRASADTASPMIFRTASQAPAQGINQLINVPVQQPGWDKAVAERVLMMAHGKLQNAELRLSPAELGPVRIHLSIEDGVASVSFHAQHAVTRDAIEQAMPRLRNMLAENGISLGQSDVSDGEVPRETHDGSGRPARDERATDAQPDSVSHAPRTAASQPGAGRVDTFA